MPDIKFKFDVDNKVKTHLGDEGAVDSAAYTKTGPHRYWVKFAGRSADYFDEEQLTLVE